MEFDFPDRIYRPGDLTGGAFRAFAAINFLFVLMFGTAACAKDTPKATPFKFDAKATYSVFVRDTGKPLKVGSAVGDTVNNELWILNEKTKEASLLVACRDSEEVEGLICDIQNPKFSPNGTKVYFESTAWVTSNSVHQVDLRDLKERFVTDGSDLRVISMGKYAGKIVVSKHKYLKGPNGGSYDHYFVVDDSGAEIEDLGDEPYMDRFK